MRKSRRERPRGKEEETEKEEGMGGKEVKVRRGLCYRRIRDFVLPSFFRLSRLPLPPSSLLPQPSHIINVAAVAGLSSLFAFAPTVHEGTRR